MAVITWSEGEGLTCCPCYGGCEKVCDPKKYCLEHAAWLEGRKIHLQEELQRIDRVSRLWIKAKRRQTLN
jgi:hypothetical protein